MVCLPTNADIRADGAHSLPGYDPFSGILHSVMAKEIREIREKLEQLAGILVGDAHFCENFLEQLQSFDYLIQHADECAGLLDRVADGEDSLQAISHIRLGAVQDRMRAALKGA